MILAKMISFVVETVCGSGGRLGSLGLREESTWKTPSFLIHTLCGSVPHLTAEVFDMLYDPKGSAPLIQVSIDTTFPFHEDIGPSGLTISRFVGLPNCSSFLTVQNPLALLPKGFNDKLGISVWPRNGRRIVNTDKFVQIVNDYQPNFFQSLSDFDVNRLSSKKRVKKSTTRNLEFLNEVFAKSVPTTSIPFATIEAAWFLVDPVEAHKTLALYLERQNALGGFVINGLKDFDSRDVEDEKVLNEILKKIPTDKPKYAPGNFNFLEILELVLKGVDLFDSSIVTQMTEEGKLLVLPLEEFLPKDAVPVPNESLPSVAKENPGNEAPESEESYFFNLKDKRYFDDFEPVLKSCDCYTCRKHTRSYIHHLLVTGELLGPVLIMYHNLFHFRRFFKAVQNSLSDDEAIEKLRNTLKKLIPPVDDTSCQDSELELAA